MTLYTSAWRDEYRDSVRSSAAALIPAVVEQLQPCTAVDVGCGEGWFVAELARLGVDTVGVDGPWVDGCTQVDLTVPPYPDLGHFDMALCLEVAEHIPAEHADTLVAWLCDLAPTVVFSAAVPGQGGVGHVNEQLPGYWAERFARYGHQSDIGLREAVADDERISWWYRNTLTVYAR